MGWIGRPHYPWRQMVAELRRTPGQWRLLPEMVAVPPSVKNAVNEAVHRQRPAGLLHPGGHVEASRGHRALDEFRHPVADIWLRWVPDNEEGNMT